MKGGSMRAKRLLLAAAVLVGITTGLPTAPAAACACGGIASPGDEVSEDHEVAAIAWDGTTETIFMQLGLSTAASDLALVIPTPSPATVSAGSEGLFPELYRLTGGPFSFEVGSSSDGAVGAAPTVVSQVQLGPLEATTLEGGDLDGLRVWLADHHYTLKESVFDAMEPYVREGWAFTAIRLTSPTPIDGDLKPVRLDFASSEFVYPMRMSAAAAEAQEVTLFVFGDGPYVRTDPDADGDLIQQTSTIELGAVDDPDLRILTEHGKQLTVMSMILDPSQITSDFVLSPGDASGAGTAAHTGAVDRSAARVLPWYGLIVVVVLGAAYLRYRVLRGRRVRSAG